MSREEAKEYLKELSPAADFLSLSATPIPRTLALIMASDLDVSIIEELPPGRKLVKTIWAKETERKKIDIQFYHKTDYYSRCI